jgi:phosphoglycerate kinase
MLLMEQLDLQGKRVLIREDFNVPMKDGKITHTARIEAALPTIRAAVQKGAKVLLLSHLGRPKEGEFSSAYSLQPIADYLSTCLDQTVRLVSIDEDLILNDGQVALLENVRFLKGEEENDLALAKALAAKADIFVMDAFAVAHRKQASTYGVAQYAPIACAGPLLQKELEAIHKVLVASEKPVLAIVGGSKVSTKLQLLNNLLDKVDVLVVGGGIANTFLAAMDLPIGESLYEPQLVHTAKTLIEKAASLGKTLWLPLDVVVAESLDSLQGTIKQRENVQSKDKIFDIGPQSCLDLEKHLKNAKTILWNGPVGVFEQPPFAQGTKALAEAIVASGAFSVAGGGDTLAAVEAFHVEHDISYLSTGGGAFLEALEGKKLPAVAILESRGQAPLYA